MKRLSYRQYNHITSVAIALIHSFSSSKYTNKQTLFANNTQTLFYLLIFLIIFDGLCREVL